MLHRLCFKFQPWDSVLKQKHSFQLTCTSCPNNVTSDIKLHRIHLVITVIISIKFSQNLDTLGTNYRVNASTQNSENFTSKLKVVSFKEYIHVIFKKFKTKRLSTCKFFIFSSFLEFLKTCAEIANWGPGPLHIQYRHLDDIYILSHVPM